MKLNTIIVTNHDFPRSKHEYELESGAQTAAKFLELQGLFASLLLDDGDHWDSEVEPEEVEGYEQYGTKETVTIENIEIEALYMLNGEVKMLKHKETGRVVEYSGESVAESLTVGDAFMDAFYDEQLGIHYNVDCWELVESE